MRQNIIDVNPTKVFILVILFLMVFIFGDCSKSKNVSSGEGRMLSNNMEVWLTKTDQSALLQKQSGTLSFTGAATGGYPVIEVDSATSYQSIDGFGFTLTGGSAYHINRMDAASRASLLKELFGRDSTGVGISYLRVSIGASDLNATVYSYDDMPTGKTDPTLANFNLSLDSVDVIPVLKQIQAINPNIKILGSPWSPPVWMKTKNSTIGGQLQTQYYGVYAKYFVKYIQVMQAKGISIDAVTVQNEPEHGGNNPSMLMTATEQANFIKYNLGPEFKSAGIKTKIIIWDHNCDHPNYPISILNDSDAKQYIDGSAFHLYRGEISALSTVKMAHPDKNLYFTEQWTGGKASFSGDLNWHVKNVLIGSLRNWSKITLLWNLASDINYNPHTQGGCTECKGALTISGNSVTRNVAYYIIAHAGKFVPAGSIRIASPTIANLPNVAFKTPLNKKVLIMMNGSESTQSFNIGYKGKYIFTSLTAGTVATYVW